MDPGRRDLALRHRNCKLVQACHDIARSIDAGDRTFLMDVGDDPTICRKRKPKAAGERIARVITKSGIDCM